MKDDDDDKKGLTPGWVIPPREKQTCDLFMQRLRAVYVEEYDPSQAESEPTIPGDLFGVYYVDRTEGSQDPAFEIFTLPATAVIPLFSAECKTLIGPIIHVLLTKPTDWRHDGVLCVPDFVISVHEAWMLLFEGPTGKEEYDKFRKSDMTPSQSPQRQQILGLQAAIVNGSTFLRQDIADGKLIGDPVWQPTGGSKGRMVPPLLTKEHTQ